MTDEKEKTIILIVEDEAAQLDLLSDEFVSDGFRVLKAHNGKEGMDLAFQEEPDIILLDLVMPVTDGITVMRKIREKNQWGRTVPIILLTNLNSNDEERMKAVIRDTPAYYLIKSESTLESIVERVRERITRV